MKIAVPREGAPGETRVALTPQAAGQLVGDGVEVLDPGRRRRRILTCPMRPSARPAPPSSPTPRPCTARRTWCCASDAPPTRRSTFLKPGTVLIGTLGTLANPELAERLAEAGITAISMDAIPRITRAQSMDTLSSQATVGGYKAVLLAAERLPKFMPLLTTAAGTVRPARVLVFGAGVAGLMAIGTAERLGAVVEATDVRPVVKEQVESLGGTFLEVEMTDEEKAQAETAGGYAREMSDDYKRRQAELIASRVGRPTPSSPPPSSPAGRRRSCHRRR